MQRLKDIITMTTLESYKQHLMYSIKEYNDGSFHYQDIETLKTFGYELVFEFIPNNTNELHYMIEFEEFVDRVSVYLYKN